MIEPTNSTTTYKTDTHTYAGIEVDLIRRHMFVEKGKLIIGAIIYAVILILVIAKAIFPSMSLDSQTLGYIVAGTGIFMASIKIKNIKEIMNLAN